MSGPVQDVLLRAAVEPDRAWELIRAGADSLGFTVRREPPDHAHLGEVRWDGDHGADLLLLPPEFERELGELEVLAQLCGYRPAGSLQVAGWGRSGAREQGRFLAALAEAGGDLMIDMNGAVSSAAGEVVALEQLRAYLAGRRGVVLEIPYETAWGDVAVSHLVDRRFMLAWLDEPDFGLPN